MINLRFGAPRQWVVVFTAALLAACSGGRSGSSATTTPEPSRTPDGANLVRTYAAMLSRDLGTLQPVDTACGGSPEACRAALDQAAVVAAKVEEDLQHTSAEPDAIQKPVEDVRAAVQFVVSIDRAFDAGTMSASEAVGAYMAEFNTLEQALHQVQAAR